MEVEMVATLKDKFTPRLRQVLELAVEEVLIREEPYLEPKHLLLGLLKEGRGVAGEILEEYFIFLRTLQQIDLRKKVREDSYFRKDHFLSHETEKILMAAHGWAIVFGHQYIGTPHVLLGLFEDPTVAKILKEADLTITKAREEIKERISLH